MSDALEAHQPPFPETFTWELFRLSALVSVRDMRQADAWTLPTGINLSENAVVQRYSQFSFNVAGAALPKSYQLIDPSARSLMQFESGSI